MKWFKNILILGLSALCVYQIAGLWFDGSVYIDFSSVLGVLSSPSRDGESYAELAEELIKPKRLLVSENGAEYNCKYSDILETNSFAQVKDALKALFERGEHKLSVITEDIDWGQIILGESPSPAIIMDYGYPMLVSPFLSVINAAASKAADSLRENIAVFDMVVIKPSAEDGMEVFFIDSLSVTKTLVSYTLSDYENIRYDEDFGRNLTYIAAVQWGGWNFERLVFTPSSQSYVYSQISSERPLDSVAINSSNVSNYFSSFFIDANELQCDYIGEYYNMHDGYARVRYYPAGFMEYENWRHMNGSITSFKDAYAEAVLFIKNDTNLDNEASLESYSYDGATYTFYFNYVINDLPVIISDAVMNDFNIKSAIEVTVNQDRVSGYKRLLQNYSTSSENIVSVGFNFSWFFSNMTALGFGYNQMQYIDAVNIGYNGDIAMRPSLIYCANIFGTRVSHTVAY